MNNKISIINVQVNELLAAEYNPRKWDDEAVKHLKESIQRFGLVDPIIVNSVPNPLGEKKRQSLRDFLEYLEFLLCNSPFPYGR